MRTVSIRDSAGITCNESSTDAEWIEQKIKRALENQEPIDDSVELYFTERAEGIKHEFNPRGDKWEMAVEATGMATKSKLAQRKEALEKLTGKDTGAPETPVQKA